MNFVFKTRNVLQTYECVSKNEEFCIKNDEFCRHGGDGIANCNINGHLLGEFSKLENAEMMENCP